MNLLLTFCGILKKRDVDLSLISIFGDVCEEYRVCKAFLLKMVNSAAVDDKIMRSIGKEEIEFFTPKYKKFVLLSHVVNHFQSKIPYSVEGEDASHLKGIQEDDLLDIRTEFQRKCLILKMDILSKIWCGTEYTPLFIQLANLQELWVLHDLVRQDDSMQFGLPKFVEQLEDVLVTSHAVKSPEEYLVGAKENVQQRTVRLYAFMYQELFMLFGVNLLEQVDPTVPVLAKGTLRTIFKDNIGILEERKDELVTWVFGLSLSGIRNEIIQDVRSSFMAISAVLAQGEIAAPDEVQDFVDSVKKVHSFLQCGDEAQRIGLDATELSMQLNQKFADGIVANFVNMEQHVLNKNSKDHFDLLGNKIMLVEKCRDIRPMFEAVYDSLKMGLMEKLEDIRSVAEAEVANLVVRADKAIKDSAADDMKIVLGLLRIASAQFGKLLPAWEVAKNAYTKTKQCVQQLVTETCAVILNNFRMPRFARTDFCDIKGLAEADLPGVEELLRESAVLDQFGYYAEFDEKTLNISTRSKLYPFRKEIVATAKTKLQQSYDFEIPSDESLVSKLALAKELVWFDKYIPSGMQTVAVVTHIVIVGCILRFRMLWSLVQDDINLLQHELMFTHVGEMTNLAKLSQSYLFCDIEGSVKGVLEMEFLSAVTSYCESIIQTCESLESLEDCFEGYPFDEYNSFVNNRPKYDEICALYSLGPDIEKKLREATAAVEWVLVTYINEPILASEKKSLELDISLLCAVFTCNPRLQTCDALCLFVPALYDYDGLGHTVGQVLKAEVSQLNSNILTLINNKNDLDALQENLDYLQHYIAVERWIGEPVATQHAFGTEQLLFLQSNLTGDLEKSIKDNRYDGVRDYLDRFNVPDSPPVFKNYKELMDLITKGLKSTLDSVQSNESNGELMCKALDTVQRLWEEVGGANGKVDHVLAYGKIDLQAEETNLRKVMKVYVDQELYNLQDFKPTRLEAMIKSADDLIIYFKALGHHVADHEQLELATFMDRCENFMKWAAGGKDNIEPLSELVMTMMSAILEQQPFDTSNGGISIAMLANILGQIQRLSVVVRDNRLKLWCNYMFWTKEIAEVFNDMFESVAISAETKKTFVTSKDILKYAHSQFNGDFMGHMKGKIDLPMRIDKLSAALNEFNKSKAWWFRTQKGCYWVKDHLDTLKTTFEGRGGFSYSSIYDGFVNGAHSGKHAKPTQINRSTYGKHAKHETLTNEYRESRDSYQRNINSVLDELKKALLDNNMVKVESSHAALMLVDETLHEHLTVPLSDSDVLIENRFKVLVGEVATYVKAKSMDLVVQKFETFYNFRKLYNNKFIMAKPSYDACVELHKSMNTMVIGFGSDLDSMLASFKFENAVDIIGGVTGTHNFIASANATDYLKSFDKKIHYYVPRVDRYGGRRQHDIKLVDDPTVTTLSRTLNSFVSQADLNRRVGEVHRTIINKVKTSVKNHEYFHLKDIAEGLRYFGLLSGLGGNSQTIIDDTRNQVMDIIKGHLSTIRSDATRYWNSSEWSKLNEAITMLSEAQEELKYFSGLIDTAVIHKIQQELELKLSEVSTRAINVACMKGGDEKVKVIDFALQLVELGHIWDQVGEFRNIAKLKINSTLNHVREKVGLGFIFKLGVILGEASGDNFKDDASKRVAGNIVREFYQFSDVSTMDWNGRARMPLEDSLKKLTSYTYNVRSKSKNNVNIDINNLRTLYNEYQKFYDSYRTEFLPSSKDANDLVKRVLAKANTLKPCTLSMWNSTKKAAIPEILGGIFAYYTLSKSKESYNSLSGEDDCKDPETILLKPHTIQVITILRLLGCIDSPTKLQNQLMQIGTGEGKSIILGALATIFGVLGFRVRCVCYSEYLSARDYQDFKKIFEAFECTAKVTYSTIVQFSEDAVGQRGDVRKLTQNLLTGTLKPVEAPGTDNSEQVLLVDEVDVFFGKDFYGQTYNQVTHLATPEVVALIRAIWKERSNKPSVAKLKNTAEYRTLINKFSNWQFLIDNELQLMCSQVNSFNKPEYTYDPDQDKIGYKEHDGTSYNLTYGYCTVFAYLHELDKGRIKPVHQTKFSEKHLHMMVSCGQFSYGNISPGCILGVTGTLSALTTYEQEVMSRYKIDQYSIAPSVYGERTMTFDHPDRKGIHVASTKADYFKNIVDFINEFSRTGLRKLKHRAIIVFFDNIARLDEFRKDDIFRSVFENQKVNRLTENVSKDQRDFYIKKAATAGQVTLATKSFGRGTDFVSRDQALIDAEGVHILQTFLSPMETEEIQIQGRTSRQGQLGSYGMCLLLEDDKVPGPDGKTLEAKPDTLQYFGITQSEIGGISRNKRYEFLCKKRNARRATESLKIEENLAESNLRDAQTRAYVNALLRADRGTASRQFQELYVLVKGEYQPQSCGVHVVFMLDESGSMDGTRFNELKVAYDSFVNDRKSSGSPDDRLSVIMFDNEARTIAKLIPFSGAPTLPFKGGWTCFAPALRLAMEALDAGAGSDLTPIIVLMTDGDCDDINAAVDEFVKIEQKYATEEIQAHFVAFGSGAKGDKLKRMNDCAANGQIHTAQMGQLTTAFKAIAETIPQAEHS